MSATNLMIVNSTPNPAVLRAASSGRHLQLRSVTARPGPNHSSAVLNMIRQHPVLGRLTEEAQRGLLTMSRSRHVKRRDSIWHQGDHASTVVLVLTGHVKLWTSLPDGSEAILEIQGPGQSAGELSVMEEAP